MRARKDKPTAPAEPLSARVRQALAAGWHTLSALEAMAGRATGARLRVHAALGELRAEGVVVEERIERGVAEVRLLTLPAPMPDDGRSVEDGGPGEGAHLVGESEEALAAEAAALDATAPRDLDALRDRVRLLARGSAGCGLSMAKAWELTATDLDLTLVEERALCGAWREVWERIEAESHVNVELETPFDHPPPRERARASRQRTCKPAPALDAPAPDAGHAAPVEAAEVVATGARAATDPLFVECRVCKADPGHPCKGVEGQAFDGSPHVMRAVDAEAWARVQDGLPPAGPAPKGPGPSSRCARPGCNLRYDQHYVPGRRGGGGCEAFQPKPRGRPRVASRLAAVQAADSDVTELPTPAEQRAILDGARQDHEAAVGYAARVEAIEGVAASLAPIALYSAIKAAGDVRVVAVDGNASTAPVYAAAPDAASETRRLVPMGPCRPPACHRDDIIRPSAVRGFARPLCAACREWVERAGGTVAPPGAPVPSTPPEIPPHCDVPLCPAPCNGPLVTRAEHHRAAEYAPDVRLVCLNCGDGREGTDEEVAKAEQARDAWERKRRSGTV